MTQSETRAVALVTGATSGIGIEIARTLIADGFTVVVSGRSVARGEAVCTELGEYASFIPADLTAAGEPRALVDAVVSRHGRIDVLVNNAAIDHTGDLLEVGEAEIAATFQANTFSAMNCLIAAGGAMRAGGRGGAIINVTSRLASIGVPTMGIYSASKGAMLAFTKASAVDLAPYNIRVNAVAPGMTATPLYDEWLAAQDDPAAKAAEVSSAIPLRRIAVPADVAAVVSFLASDRATYVTGVSIPVDGGYLAT